MGNNRTVCILKLPRKVDEVIVHATSIVNKMTGNTFFTTPSPSLTSVTTAINNLLAAQAAVETGLSGATKTRDDKQLILVTLLNELCAYVQITADSKGDLAEEVILSAGMYIRAYAHKYPQVFTAVSELAGTVVCTSEVNKKRYAIEWYISSDSNVWTIHHVTTISTANFTGLTSGAIYNFKYRVIIGEEASDFSQIVSCRVK